MPTHHDAVAALPESGNANKEGLRNVLVKRMPYVLADTDDPTDLVAIDPDTGAVIIDILFLGRVFHLDEADTTTAHDGVSCLVSQDGLRYKLSDQSSVFAYSVLDNTIATPPGTPAIGDAYLVAAGATGAWAGHSDDVTVYTRRGWEFITFGIGRFVYVESVDTYYHRDSGGTWVTGFGNHTFSANSIPLSAAINFGKRLIVENQTTNAPPGSPSIGDAYIIGPSPTGAWAGKSLKIAICEDGATFTVYTATNGWAAYDKALNNSFTFSGTAWISSAGSIVNAGKAFTAGAGSWTTGGSGPSTYSATVAPTRTNRFITDPVSLTYTAKAIGARLRFIYRSDLISSDTGAQSYIAGINRDSEASALDWTLTNFAAGNPVSTVPLIFEITATDTASHAYWVSFFANSTGNIVTGGSRRLFTVEEFAA